MIEDWRKANYRHYGKIMNWDEKFIEAESCTLISLFAASGACGLNRLISKSGIYEELWKLLRINSCEREDGQDMENAVPDNNAEVYLIRTSEAEY